MQVLFIAKCKYYLRKENRVKLKPCQKGLVICGLAKTLILIVWLSLMGSAHENTHVANQHKRITIKIRFPYSST